MIEIFVDGIRSVGVANGLVRIEFAQLRRSTDGVGQHLYRHDSGRSSSIQIARSARR